MDTIVDQYPVTCDRDDATWIGEALIYDSGTVDIQCEAIASLVKVDGRQRAMQVMDAESGGGVLAYSSWEAAAAAGWHD